MKHKLKGFTLIEMLIVVSIIAILTIYGATTIADSSDEIGFLNLVNQVAAEIREARSLALTGQTVPDYTDFDENLIAHKLPNGDCPPKDENNQVTCNEEEEVLAAGVGVEFTNQAVHFFLDLHNQGEGEFDYADSTADPPNFIKTADILYDGKTIDLTDSNYENIGIHLSDSSKATASERTVIYTPPFGNTILTSKEDKELLIWFYRKDIGYTNNGENFGKVILINRISGIPEVYNASEITGLETKFPSE